MLAGQFAIAIAALFAGAAVYINVAEQPARMLLHDGALLTEWKLSYKRGYAMQASLAMLGFLAGIAAWWQTDDPLWIGGAVALIANWPYTLFLMMPTNRQLMETDPQAANAETRAAMHKWARLHAVRTALGFLAVILFLAASLA